MRNLESVIEKVRSHPAEQRGASLERTFGALSPKDGEQMEQALSKSHGSA
jgi:hypothetical protein